MWSEIFILLAAATGGGGGGAGGGGQTWRNSVLDSLDSLERKMALGVSLLLLHLHIFFF